MEGGIHAEEDGGFLPLGRRKRQTDRRFSRLRNYEKSDERKKSMPNQTKGSREIKTYVSSGTKTEMPMEAEESYLKQFYGI